MEQNKVILVDHNITKNHRKLAEILESKEKNSYFVIGVTILFSIIVLALGVAPSYLAFTAQATENSKRQMVIDKAKKKTADISRLSSELTSETDTIKVLNKVLPNKAEQEVVYNELREIFEKNEFVLKSISFNQESKPSKKYLKLAGDPLFKTMNLNIIADTQNPSFAQLISEIEDQKRVYDIRSVVLSRGEI